MRDELIAGLRRDFPLFYGETYFEVQDGWHGLLRKMGERCEPLLRDMTEEAREEARCRHAKQKYTRLQVHIMHPKLSAISDHFEARSDFTCEGCGLEDIPGRPYVLEQVVRDGWEHLYCAACATMTE